MYDPLFHAAEILIGFLILSLDVHKKHHEFFVTIGIAAEYAHPVITKMKLIKNK